MGTTLHDSALANKVNLVALLDGAQTMGNGDDRSTFGGSVQGILNDTLTVAIQSRRRLVQYQEDGSRSSTRATAIRSEHKS
jgi:hypothetical protein